MRSALIGQAYYIFVAARLARRQLPGYYLTEEEAESVRSRTPNAYISSIHVVSYDNGRTFHRITVAGESEQALVINRETAPVVTPTYITQDGIW